MKIFKKAFVLTASLFGSGVHAAEDVFVSDDWQSLQVAVEEHMLPHDKPFTTGGAVIVMHSNETIFQGAYGQANREWNIPWTIDTQYYTASVGKSFTAQIAIMLHDEGLIDLNAPVSDYIEDFPLYSETVRVWHLLSMRSGLNFGVEALWFSGRPIGGFGYRGMNNEERFDFVFSQPSLGFIPGEGKQGYEDVAYAVLGEVITSATGMEFQDVLDKYIANPLLLSSTGAPPWQHFWTVLDQQATHYISAEGQDIPNIATEEPYTHSNSTGVMYTTPRELADWVAASIWGRASAPSFDKPIKLFKRMTEPAELDGKFSSFHTDPTADSRYGYGIFGFVHRGHPVYGHSGYYGAEYAWIPSLDLGVVVMNNEIGKIDNSSIIQSIIDVAINQIPTSAVKSELINPRYADHVYVWPNARVPQRLEAGTRKELDGIFYNHELGRVLVGEKDGGIYWHRLDGQWIGFEATDGSSFVGFAGDSIVRASISNGGLTLNGYGLPENSFFEKLEPQELLQRERDNIIGVYYNEAWDSYYSIEANDNGKLVLKTGDRTSLAGDYPLEFIQSGLWIANGDSAMTVVFDENEEGMLNFNRFRLRTYAHGPMVFRRIEVSR